MLLAPAGLIILVKWDLVQAGLLWKVCDTIILSELNGISKNQNESNFVY